MHKYCNRKIAVCTLSTQTLTLLFRLIYLFLSSSSSSLFFWARCCRANLVNQMECTCCITEMKERKREKKNVCEFKFLLISSDHEYVYDIMDIFVSSIIIGTRGFNMIIIMFGFYHCVGQTWKKPQLVIVKLQPNLGERTIKNLQIYWKMYSFSGSLSFINWICDDTCTHTRWLIYSISKMSIKTCLQSYKCDCVKNNLKPHQKNRQRETCWKLSGPRSICKFMAIE